MEEKMRSQERIPHRIFAYSFISTVSIWSEILYLAFQIQALLSDNILKSPLWKDDHNGWDKIKMFLTCIWKNKSIKSH